MVVEADALLQQIWDRLNEKGYDFSNTYVLHVSDHGELAFDHHQVRKGSMYEGSVRVPLQIAGPGISKQRVSSHLTSLLDVFPTILDIAQETHWDKHSGLGGKSLLGVVSSGYSEAPADMKLFQHKDKRDYVISQYKWMGSSVGSYMLRSGPWKYIRFGHTFRNPAEHVPMLFDLEEDPEELINLAESNVLLVARFDLMLQELLDVDNLEMELDMTHFSALVDLYGDKMSILTHAKAILPKSDVDTWLEKAWGLWETSGWSNRTRVPLKFKRTGNTQSLVVTIPTLDDDEADFLYQPDGGLRTDGKDVNKLSGTDQWQPATRSEETSVANIVKEDKRAQDMQDMQMS